MTRLQQEVARKLHTLEYESKYHNESGILNITMKDKPICRLHSDENYTYRSDKYIQQVAGRNIFKG